MRAIGVDVGGTKLAIGRLSGSGELYYYTERPLPGLDYDRLLNTIAEAVQNVHDSHSVSPRLGVAMAGWLSPDRERVVAAASLGWTDRKLRQDLAELTGLETIVHNDANSATWGEYLLAGRPKRGAFVMLTLGTDVGGGVIADGRLLTGAFGVAGELGHLQVRADGPRCVCGSRGCLAVYASGKAMLASARRAVAHAPAEAPLLSKLCGNNPVRLRGHDVATAAQQGDKAALGVVREAAAAIAAVSAMISRIVDHHTLVLGGGASAIGPVLQQAVVSALRVTTPLGPVLPLPEVRLARAGNRAGVLGAADLAASAE
ncbi:ROK family protein [Streptomyces sp. NBS 14/10]|uniref:ROK family protein n=1 Tax=Streptomyces sp. NBS 14/10 TaxID=1945643 RepID=UPI0015C5BCDD|nr:ROK family protein [Streptomyces sp. NBS 14/10]KAK1184366.1 ROK family protein [Streptomyces sp. NBS 14/10]